MFPRPSLAGEGRGKARYCCFCNSLLLLSSLLRRRVHRACVCVCHCESIFSLSLYIYSASSPCRARGHPSLWPFCPRSFVFPSASSFAFNLVLSVRARERTRATGEMNSKTRACARAEAYIYTYRQEGKKCAHKHCERCHCAK